MTHAPTAIQTPWDIRVHAWHHSYLYQKKKKTPACHLVHCLEIYRRLSAFGWEETHIVRQKLSKKKNIQTPTVNLLPLLPWELNIKGNFFLTLKALVAKLKLWWIAFLNNFVNKVVIMVIGLEIYGETIISINYYS